MSNEQVECDLVYEQRSGCLYLADPEDVRALIARGYAGKGIGLNNPEAESIKGTGPIPRGMWRLSPPIHHARLGPCSIRATPVGHDAKGRDGFFIHGDNALRNRSASSGCIVVGLGVRQAIVGLNCRSLLVV